MELGGCEIDKLVERQGNHRLIEHGCAAISMIDERHDHRNRWHSVRGGARGSVKVETADLAHARNEQARIEAADHVAFALVSASAQVAAVENTSICMDAAAAVALEAGGAPQRLCVVARIIPKVFGIFRKLP